VNVLDADDPFAARVLAEGHGDGRGDERGDGAIADALTESRRGDPHELLGYLRDPATARAVLGAWCDAAQPGARGCAALLPAGRPAGRPVARPAR
jgi:hypothetical protein